MMTSLFDCIVEGFEASNSLILTEGGQKIGKLMLRDLELADGLG